MPGNSQRKGAVRKKGKTTPAGSGGRVRRGLEGKGPTPKAEDRPYHKAYRRRGPDEPGKTTSRPRSGGGRAPRPRAGGTATVIGMIPIGQNVELPGVAFLSEKKIQGSNMGSNRFRVDMPRYIDMYMDGRLKLDELVSARISLDEINDGFAAMKTGEVARSVIVFD